MRIKNIGACYPSIALKYFTVRLDYDRLVQKYRWDKGPTYFNEETIYSIQIGCPVKYIKRQCR